VRRQRGSMSVEFALVLPLVILALFTVAEVAGVAKTQIELTNAAREGARTAAVDPEPAAAAQVVRAALGDAASQAIVTVSRPHIVGEPAVVSITFNHTLAPFLMGGAGVQLRATASMRVER